MKNEIIVQKQDLIKPETIKAEVNFLQYPFFFLFKKGLKDTLKISYRRIKKRGDKKVELIWEVTANPEYGFPGPFDMEVHMAIQKIISDLGFPVKNPISFSLYELCQIMGISDSGKNLVEIEKALKREVMTGVFSKETFYEKRKNQYLGGAFHLYEAVFFRGDKMSDGTIAEKVYLFLSSWFLASLNSGYIKPIDYGIFKSLKTYIAKRLYQILDIKFYGLNGPFWRVTYEELCQLLPIEVQKYFSYAKRILEKPHNELIEKGLLKKVEYTQIEKHPEFLIDYYPGPLAKKSREKKTFIPTAKMLPEPKPESKKEDPSEMPSFMNIDSNSMKKLVKKYGLEEVIEKINILEWEYKDKEVQNPYGLLQDALKNDYLAPDDYLLEAGPPPSYTPTTPEPPIVEKMKRLEKEKEAIEEYKASLSPEKLEEVTKQATEWVKEKTPTLYRDLGKESVLLKGTIDSKINEILKEEMILNGLLDRQE